MANSIKVIIPEYKFKNTEKLHKPEFLGSIKD